jgi:predicted phage terminase large subunit-like protein
MAAAGVKAEWLEKLRSKFCEPQAEAETEPLLTFREFVDRVYPKYQWYRHNVVLGNALQRVADGELKRLMVFMPPRGGKSLLTSKLFPAYYLYRHPDRFVGLNAYSAELAYTFSRASREAFLQNGGTLKGDAAAVKHWETEQGGGCWAAGVGGSITGKGYSLGLIDDPLKNAEEAFSDKIRAKQKEWYESTFYTRAEPDGAIVVVQTRWHQDDLSGWLLSEEAGSDQPEGWHIVNFEAIKEETLPDFPKTCTVEPDWRSPGEALCPERFTLKRLLQIMRKVGTLFWSAMYQQRPSPAEGDYFKRSWWKFYPLAPAQFDRVILSADCTFKESKKSDFVVLQIWGQKGGEFWLLDQVRGRMDINATITAIRALCAKWPQATAKLVEDKANGSAVIDLLKREISGLLPIEPEGGKLVRAVAIAPYVEAGNVYIPDPAIAAWVNDYIEEFAVFPNGVNDDQVDATSQALNWLKQNPPPVPARRYTPTSSRNW